LEPTAAPTDPPPTATPTALAQELFDVVETPVLSSGFANARTFIDPGAVIVHDGQFHMFYNGIDSYPAPVGGGYATSSDGLTWTRPSVEPVFGPSVAGFPAEMRNAILFVTSGLVQPDGTWVLYYYLTVGGDFNGRHTIGRATAPAPTGPWTTSPEPVLEPGPEGAWDSGQVSGPTVLAVDGGYVMYYEGVSSSDKLWRVGRATSPDGLTWTKHDDPATTEPAFAESDPVFAFTAAPWEATRVLDPNVVRTADGWLMVYVTNNGTNQKYVGGPVYLTYAASLDGLTWTPAGVPLVTPANHPAWRGIYLVTFVESQGQYFLYFDVATGGTNVFLATYDGPLPP
jgi:predicted GH43/DUF377 family glycosyl hydrolase